MSANKRMCLRSATEKRQSFSERICDDLCEEILKFLPIEDRFRLEGVSKQFQRTVFKSQNVVSIDFNRNFDDLLKKCKIFLKCVNVNQIEIPYLMQISFQHGQEEMDQHFILSSDTIDEYNKLVELIIKNCNNLSDFDFYMDIMNEENRNNFIEKFGSKLISVNLENCEKPEVFLSSMKVNNIKKLIINRMTPALSQLNLSKLNSFKIELLKEKELEQFEVFIERHRNSLKFLTIRTSQFKNRDSFTQQLIKIVSKFDQLIHLSLKPETEHFRYYCCHFNDYLKQIALNCKQLRSFECSLQFYSDPQLLTPLKNLKHLKRLRIEVNYCKCGETYTQIIPLSKVEHINLYEQLEQLSFQWFEGFKSITHLCLNLPTCYPLLATERRLQNIDLFYRISNSFKSMTCLRGANC